LWRAPKGIEGIVYQNAATPPENMQHRFADEYAAMNSRVIIR
jgi:hypothetical protein